MNSAVSLDDLQHIPRPVRLRWGTILGRILASTFFICVLMIGPLKGVSAIDRLHRLQQSGIVIDADLVDASINHGKSTSYYFTVAFKSGDTPVASHRLVTEQLYFAYSNGHTVPVTVSPADPNDFEIGRMTDEVIASTQAYWFWCVLALAAFAGALAAAVETSLYGERKLMTTGQVVMGTITEVVRQNQKSAAMNVTYSFETSLGPRESTCFAQGNVAARHPVGSSVIVFYRPDNEKKSRPLPFFQMIELDA